MDLRTRKYIKNTKSLPRFETGTEYTQNAKPGLNALQMQRLIDGGLNLGIGGKTSLSGIGGAALNKFSTNAGKGFNVLPTKTELNNLGSKLPSPGGTGVGDVSGIADKAQSIFGGAMQAAGVVGNIISNSKTKIDSDEVLNKYGTSQQSIGGIGFEQQNDIDSNKEMDAENAEIKGNTMGSTLSGASAGASIGSVAGPWGTAIGGAVGAIGGLLGGIFGGSKRRREAMRQLRIAKDKALTKNENSRSSATSQLLQKRFAEEYGNQEDQLLFAAYGKDDVDPITNQTYKNHVVDTAYGMAFMPQTAWGSKGEWIESEDGSLHKIKRGPNDTARIHVSDGDTIYSAKLKNPITGHSIAKDVPMYAQAGMLDELKFIQQEQRNMKVKNRNRIPRLAEGAEWYTNLIPAVSGTLIGLGQYNDARRQEVYRSNTFKANPYAQIAINDLDKLSINPYPIMQQQRAAEARSAGAITQSGGLSAGQRALSRIASLNATQQNIANAISAIQSQNNQYRANAAQARLTVGNQEATRRQAAEQWDTDMYAKAHAARQQGMQMGMYNFQNALEQYFANEFKRKQFNDQLSLYRDDLKIRRGELQALLNNNNTSSASTSPKYSLLDQIKSGIAAPGNINGSLYQSYIPSSVLPSSTELDNLQKKIQNIPVPVTVSKKSTAGRRSNKRKK